MANAQRCEGVKNPIQAKAWCQNFVKIGKNPRRKNSERDCRYWGYRKFHGRGPDKIITCRLPGTIRTATIPNSYHCGSLIRFIVGEGVELEGQYGDEPEAISDDFWAEELTFFHNELLSVNITIGWKLSIRQHKQK